MGCFSQLLDPSSWRKEDPEEHSSSSARSCNGQCLHLTRSGNNQSLWSLFLITFNIFNSRVPFFTTITASSWCSTLIEFDDYLEKKTGFNSFTSTISLHVPNEGIIECDGNARADKKSSFDSAALALLSKLKGKGRIVIVES